MCLQIGCCGTRINRDELVRLASEPTASNVLVADSLSAMTDAARDRIANALCNSQLYRVTNILKFLRWNYALLIPMALPLGSEERQYEVRFVLGGLFGRYTGWSSTVLWSEEPTAGRTTGDWYQDFKLVKILSRVAIPLVGVLTICVYG